MHQKYRSFSRAVHVALNIYGRFKYLQLVQRNESDYLFFFFFFFF